MCHILEVIEQAGDQAAAEITPGAEEEAECCELGHPRGSPWAQPAGTGHVQGSLWERGEYLPLGANQDPLLLLRRAAQSTLPLGVCCCCCRYKGKSCVSERSRPHGGKGEPGETHTGDEA